MAISERRFKIEKYLEAARITADEESKEHYVSMAVELVEMDPVEFSASDECMGMDLTFTEIMAVILPKGESFYTATEMTNKAQEYIKDKPEIKSHQIPAPNKVRGFLLKDVPKKYLNSKGIDVWFKRMNGKNRYYFFNKN